MDQVAILPKCDTLANNNRHVNTWMDCDAKGNGEQSEQALTGSRRPANA